MTTHLTEDQITSVLCGEGLTEVAQQHLESCIVCKKRVDVFVDATVARRQQMETEQPDWRAQKTAILQAVKDRQPEARRQRPRWLRPTLAAAAVVALAVTAGLLQNPSTQQLIPTPTTEMSVERILAQTESLLADESIPGFEVFSEFDEADLDDVLPALGSS